MRTQPDLVLSPRSGRPTVAQQFTAGVSSRNALESVKRTTEDSSRAPQSSASRTQRDLPLFFPAVNCWATVSRPLRGLGTRSSVVQAGQPPFLQSSSAAVRVGLFVQAI